MRLQSLIEGLGIEAVASTRGASAKTGGRICDVTDDSRTVMPGSLFIARPGSTADGRRFIADAVRAGAAAVLTDRTVGPDAVAGPGGGAVLLHAADVPPTAAALVERFYGDPSSKLTLLGVTGTNGKTTVAHLLHQILNHADIRCGLIGTVMVDDGNETARAEMTTPGATELSHTLSVMVENGCAAAAAEVSSHALDQRRADGLAFDVAVFTNLSGDHLDYHGTMAAYAAAKARLFGLLPADGAAVVNGDDAHAGVMLGAVRGARAVRCSTATARPAWADAWGRAGSATPDGFDAVLEGPWGEVAGRVALVGRHNLSNVLLACAAAFEAGVDAARIEAALPGLAPPPGRLEAAHGEGPGPRVYVDYAHTDDALESVLSAVRGVTPAGARVWVVFGAGGDRDRTKRPRMMRAALRGADRVVVTSDNPRTEPASRIIDDILSGAPGEPIGEEGGRVFVDADRRRAIERAVRGAGESDVVVIAGKGHEREQVLPDGAGGVRAVEFDDAAEARRAWSSRSGSSAEVVGARSS